MEIHVHSNTTHVHVHDYMYMYMYTCTCTCTHVHDYIIIHDFLFFFVSFRQLIQSNFLNNSHWWVIPVQLRPLMMAGIFLTLPLHSPFPSLTLLTPPFSPFPPGSLPSLFLPHVYYCNSLHYRLIDYRSFILYWCPSVTVLDGISTTDMERFVINIVWTSLSHSCPHSHTDTFILSSLISVSHSKVL